MALADDLIALMQRECAALRRGDMARLQRLTRTKTDLVARLEAQAETLDAETLQRLHDTARRTESTLSAALAGVRDARAQIESLKRRDERVYGRDGARARLDPGQGTLEKRA